MRSGQKKNFAFAAAMIAVLLSLAAAELMARGFSPTYRRMHEPPHPFLQSHPTRQWTLTPGYRGREKWDVEFRVNVLGFRGPEVTKEKPAGVFRVLILGDSIALGAGLPEEVIVSSRLESRLKQDHPEKNFQVINAGMSGYDLEQEQRLFEEEGLDLAPDAAVLIACLNDVPGVSISELINPLRDLPIPFKHFLLNHFALALMIQAAYDSIGLREESRLGDRLNADTSLQTQARIEQGWRAYEAGLAAMAKESRQRNIKLILVLVPHAAQFEDPRQRFIPQRRLAAMCQKLDIFFLDLAPEFSALPALPYILPDPVHPNPKGHEIMARMISDRLKPYILPP